MIYDNIWKVTADVENDCTGCLLDYPYFKKYYIMLAIDRRNQQALDADPRAIEKINFTDNLYQPGNTKIFIIEEVKEVALNFSQGTVRVL